MDPGFNFAGFTREQARPQLGFKEKQAESLIKHLNDCRLDKKFISSAYEEFEEAEKSGKTLSKETIRKLDQEFLKLRKLTGRSEESKGGRNEKPNFEALMQQSKAAGHIDIFDGLRVEIDAQLSTYRQMTPLTLNGSLQFPTSSQPGSFSFTTQYLNWPAEMDLMSMNQRGQQQGPSFIAVGRCDNSGRLDARFFKPMGNFTYKVVGEFMGPSSQMSGIQFEVDHKSRWANHGFKASSNMFDFNMVQTLMRPFYGGFSYMYIPERDMYMVNYGLQYSTPKLSVTATYLSAMSSFSVATQYNPYMYLKMFADFHLELAKQETTASAGLTYTFEDNPMAQYQVAVTSQGKLKTHFQTPIAHPHFMLNAQFCAEMDYKNPKENKFGISLGFTARERMEFTREKGYEPHGMSDIPNLWTMGQRKE